MIDYLIALINEFGLKYRLTDKESYLYLQRYGAIAKIKQGKCWYAQERTKMIAGENDGVHLFSPAGVNSVITILSDYSTRNNRPT